MSVAAANSMTVRELASVLNGFVDAGHGNSEVIIMLDHGDKNRDHAFDLSIDNVTLINLCGEWNVYLETFLFEDNVKDMLHRFESEE